MRDQRHTGQATAILRTVLRADPLNVGANYILATILVRQPDAAGREEGAQRLRTAAAQVPLKPAACAAKLGWYSIYVSLGEYLYKTGDAAGATTNYQAAEQHEAVLFPYTKLALYEDLGRLYSASGDFDRAISYLTKASQAGSRDALAKIAAIRKLRAS